LKKVANSKSKENLYDRKKRTVFAGFYKNITEKKMDDIDAYHHRAFDCFYS